MFPFGVGYYEVRFNDQPVIHFQVKKKSNALDQSVSFATQLHKVSNCEHYISVRDPKNNEILYLDSKK